MLLDTLIDQTLYLLHNLGDANFRDSSYNYLFCFILLIFIENIEICLDNLIYFVQVPFDIRKRYQRKL